MTHIYIFIHISYLFLLVPSQGLCLLLQPFTSFLSFLPFSPELVELEELCHLGMMMKTLMPSYFIHYFDLFCENCVCCLQLNGMPQCLCKSKGIHGMPSELLPYQVTPLGHHAISAINWPTGDFVNLALLMAWGGLAASAEWLDHWMIHGMFMFQTLIPDCKTNMTWRLNTAKNVWHAWISVVCNVVQ